MEDIIRTIAAQKERRPRQERKALVAIYVDANNDRNGNPRRGWAIYDLSGTIIEFVDEGYHGYQALDRKGYGGIGRSGAISITPSQYNEFVREYVDRG